MTTPTPLFGFYFLCLGIQAPTALLDNSVLRSRAQLGKKRAPRTRPSKAARQNVARAQEDEGTSEEWLYKDSTGSNDVLCVMLSF